jgi:hypothetical protein
MFFRLFQVCGIDVRMTARARDYAARRDIVRGARHCRQIGFVTLETRLRIDWLGGVGAGNAKPRERSDCDRDREKDYD